MNLHRHFFIIGAQRSGTTYLYEVLDEHPEIQMAKPVRPEPKYFLDFEALRQKEIAYFNKFFSENPAVKWYGEKSTTYYEFIDAGKRIDAFFPESRIIMILRNPIYRAISNYNFSKKHGLETRSLEEVFVQKKELVLEDPNRFSTNPLAYLERGEYINYLKPYLELFSNKRFKVLIFEEFVGSQNEVSNLYNWFGLNDDFKPSLLTEKVNASGDEHVEVDEEVKSILKQHYESYNNALEELLERDLSVWK